MGEPLSVEARLRAALEAIRDFEPEQDHSPLDNDDCAKCAEWRARNHPIQHMCDEHYRVLSARERNNQDAHNRMGWHFQIMARDALWGVDHD